MAEAPNDSLVRSSRRRSWMLPYGSPKEKQRDWGDSRLPSPQEGRELALNSAQNARVSLTRTSSSSSASKPSPPRRSSTSSSLSQLLTSSSTSSFSTASQFETHSSQWPLSGSGMMQPSSSSPPVLSPRGSMAQLKSPDMNSRTSGSFGKMALNSMIGGLSALSLTRSTTNEDKESRGRAMSSEKRKNRSSSFVLPNRPDKERDSSSIASKESSSAITRARSQSPFSLRRFRSRDREVSPSPVPLEDSDTESSLRRSPGVRPRTAFTDDGDYSGSDYNYGEETEDEDDDWSDDGAAMFDPVTERNTEQNAQIVPGAVIGELDPDPDAQMEPDPLGEGVNVVVPPEPYFPSTLNRTSMGSIKGRRGNLRQRKSKHHETLPLTTSRPIFQRDRCTITIVQGDPEAAAERRRKRRYVVASDLSEESRYAVEWGIGTVLREGDEMLIVTVVENESKVDPPLPNNVDRTTKLRSQQERQGLAYILVRQATSLLQRTKLHVSVSCQAWHAKNSRHMLLDIVDYNEPTMLIVGSRGLGQIKGILLGSTSHYLIQRCSVPVMVARRRLKRPPKRSAHLAKHRVHVSLAEAGIDRVAPKVDQDVAVMRNELQRDDERRGEENERRMTEEGDHDNDAEEDGDGGEGEGYLGTKVRG